MTIPVHLPGTAIEKYRERCEDADGAAYVVIVWRLTPGLTTTAYTLDDGSPVTMEDDCTFTIDATGKTISRCAAAGDPDDDDAVAEPRHRI